MRRILLLAAICWSATSLGKIYQCNVFNITCADQTHPCHTMSFKKVAAFSVDTTIDREQGIDIDPFKISCFGDEQEQSYFCSILRSDDIFPTKGLTSIPSPLYLMQPASTTSTLVLDCQ